MEASVLVCGNQFEGDLGSAVEEVRRQPRAEEVVENEAGREAVSKRVESCLGDGRIVPFCAFHS